MTLNEIGIIDERSKRNLNMFIRLTSKVPGNPLIATIATEHKNIKTNKALEIALISISIEPNFGCGSLLFF